MKRPYRGARADDRRGGDHRDRGSLSRREREVMALVVSSLLNKQVGGEFGISEISVKAHRGKMMRKMKAGSLADLLNMAARLRLAPAPKGGHSMAVLTEA
jgi:FixJ family two-component response regulator